VGTTSRKVRIGQESNDRSEREAESSCTILPISWDCRMPWKRFDVGGTSIKRLKYPCTDSSEMRWIILSSSWIFQAHWMWFMVANRMWGWLCIDVARLSVSSHNFCEQPSDRRHRSDTPQLSLTNSCPALWTYQYPSWLKALLDSKTSRENCQKYDRQAPNN
jgi:hypothetical protein